MSQRIPVLLVLIAAVAIASPSRADDGWSLSKLNPFKKKESALERTQRAHASFSDEAPERGLLPKMSIPKWGTRSHTPKRAEPSTLAKLNQGTKDLFGKTKDVLMPWSDSSKKKNSRSRQSEKKPSILTSWLRKKEEPKRPKTVRDFLDQPRPGF